jgi:hypothetical protein
MRKGCNVNSIYTFKSQEGLDAYNLRKLQEVRDHTAGYESGGSVDPEESQAYQYGQMARMENDAEGSESRPWWKLW